MSDRRRSKLGIALLALLGGVAGGLVGTLVHDARAAETKPGVQTAASSLATTDAKVAALEQTVVSLEQKLSAFRSAYDGHTHTYDAPPGGTRMNLTMLKQVMNGQPDSYIVYLQSPGQNAFSVRSSSGPKAP